MKTLDEIYAAALAVDPVSYRVGNEKFERFVQCATPVAVTGMIDEIRSLRQKLEAAQGECERLKSADEKLKSIVLYLHAIDKTIGIESKGDIDTFDAVCAVVAERDAALAIIKKAQEQEPYGYVCENKITGQAEFSFIDTAELPYPDAEWLHLYTRKPIPADHSEDDLPIFSGEKCALVPNHCCCLCKLASCDVRKNRHASRY